VTSPPTAFDGLSVALGDRYSLERELGHGGMATVYLALDLKLHRQVALKVLRPELAASLGSERFHREIEIAARLSHPHILPLHDSGDAGGHLYYAMPYVDGESLRQRLEREGQLPIAEVIAIVQAVASALTYAHHHGIIHRDIKPENILLARDSEGGPAHPLVADFGIARALDAAGGERLTETGLALGTPAYMSPEQASSDRHLDGRSDIYALGCVAYEMIAGSPPFTGSSAQAILARHAVDPVPPLHTVRATIPPAVEAAIKRTLAKVPADRFATSDEFAQAMAATGEPARRTFTSERRRLVPVLAVAAAVIGAGALFFRESAAPSVVASASRIAVLPFLSPAADTALARLGKDLATTISASLDGIGGIETADRLSIATSTAGKNDFSPAAGADLARRLGATSVVRGTLVRSVDQVRLDAGLYGSEGLAPLTQSITVTAHRDSIRTLTDSASLRLLRQVWQRGEPPSPSLAAVTTRSIPALRAFLDGERAMVEDRWVDAELAYAAAIKEDSTFWLAYWRHGYAKGWKLEEPDSASLSVVSAHLAELPEKERVMAENWLRNQREPYTEESLKRARAVTERFPNYWPGWLVYADGLLHMGPLLGHDLRQAREAFQRALQLHPRLLPAIGHLNGIAIVLEDAALETSTAARLDSLTPPKPAAPTGLEVRILRPMYLHLMTGGHFEGPLADTVAGHAIWIKSVQDQSWSAVWFSSNGRPAAQLELSRRVLAATPGQAQAAFHRKGIALAWAGRGAWDSALVAMDAHADRAFELAGLSEEEIIETGAAPELAKLDAYRIAVIGAWLGALDPEHSVSRRKAAAQATARFESPRREAELFWLDGLLAAAKRDLVGLRRARRQLMQGDTTWTRPSLRSLAAFELELLGRRREATDSMAAVSWEWWRWDRSPYFIGINRLAAARWLAERDPDQAARLLPWHQAGIISEVFNHGVVVLDGLSYLEMAGAEVARGDHRLAREYYQRFLQRYDLPSPKMRHLVDEARAALARLEADT
jgi:tRNA A-37 threonylcarbamoyl transferase component Bud32/TolB-like protein